MDYSLAALKLLCGQLKDAREVASQKALTLGGILFQRAWLQGLLIAVDYDKKVLLDDGTGVVELSLAVDFRQRQWNAGMYVMVVGGCFSRTDDIPLIKIEKRCGTLKFWRYTNCSTSPLLKDLCKILSGEDVESLISQLLAGDHNLEDASQSVPFMIRFCFQIQSTDISVPQRLSLVCLSIESAKALLMLVDVGVIRNGNAAELEFIVPLKSR